MRSLNKECETPSPLVAEPWLTTLVEAIKKEDHAVAEREYQTVRRADLIAQNGPVFWRKFTDVLEALFRQMEELFGNHVTKGKISFTRSPYGGGISINKSAYPFVSFSATPNFSENTAHFTYTVVNPEIPQNTGVPGRFLPCRFGVEGDAVVMSLDGTMFVTPESAAKFIIEKLFTISTPARAVVAEPEQAGEDTPVEPRTYSDFAWPPVRTRPAAFPTLDEPEFAYAPHVEAAEAVTESVPETLPAVHELKAPKSTGPPPLPISAICVGVPEAPRSSYASRFLASASRLLGGTSGSRTLPLPAPEVIEAVTETACEPPVSSDVVCAEAVCSEAVCEPAEEALEPVMHPEPLMLVPAVPRRKIRPQKPRSRLSYHDPRRQPGYKRGPATVVAAPDVELKRAAGAGS